MTYLEIDAAMIALTRAQCAACEEKLTALAGNVPTERKAIQLELGIYTFCGNAGLLFHSPAPRENWLKTRRKIVEKTLPKYPRLLQIYSELEEEKKPYFVAAVQAELFIRDQWLGQQRAELAAAEEAGDVRRAFETKIKIGTAEAMFDAWEAWRIEHNIFPHLFAEVNP
ncbi:MAG: hypothetical protein IJF49_07090 [Clostridia bacterium]|nr:hypothetical protein [Clostridia bacterium]